jgi:hypothetical protein
MPDYTFDWLNFFADEEAVSNDPATPTSNVIGPVQVDVSVSTGSVSQLTDSSIEASSFGGEAGHLRIGMDANAPGESTTVKLDFTNTIPAFANDGVTNLSFTILDVDALFWIDVVEVNAFAPDGTPVPVTLTPSAAPADGGPSISGDTMTGTSNVVGGANTTGNVTVDAAGPVGSVELVYSAGSALAPPAQTIGISDLDFFAVECFVRGTKILTTSGEVAIEEIRSGDMVLTRDNGPQAVRWVGNRAVPGFGKVAPVVISKDALGNSRELRVSPQHRMLITGERARHLFGEEEVLVSAKHLINGDTIYREEVESVEYFHILFDKHQIVTAEGIAAESFHPGATTLSSMTDENREEILSLFPELREDVHNGYGPVVRTILKGFEAKALLN